LILAKYCCDQNNNIISFEVSGHDNEVRTCNNVFCKFLSNLLNILGHNCSEKTDENIFCSAISAMSQMVVVSLTAVKNIKPELKIEKGYISFIVPEDSRDDESVKLILAGFIKSLKEIEKKYVNRISVEEMSQ